MTGPTPRRMFHSKLMAWLALDRALQSPLREQTPSRDPSDDNHGPVPKERRVPAFAAAQNAGRGSRSIALR
jgi:hypothetical protein